MMVITLYVESKPAQHPGNTQLASTEGQGADKLAMLIGMQRGRVGVIIGLSKLLMKS